MPEDFVNGAMDALTITLLLSKEVGPQSQDYSEGFMEMMRDWVEYIQDGKQVDMSKYAPAHTVN